MNRMRRKELERALSLIGEAIDIIESCRYDEQDALDNLPEGIQMSERGESMEEYISIMEEAVCDIERAAESIDSDVICA